MALAVRIIPCLDVREGRVVKGVKFTSIRDAGDPVEAAARYEQEGADELCVLDIDATSEGRAATRKIITAVAEQLTIPLTVGGGVGDEEAFDLLLHAGADKVSINSAALAEPDLISRLAKHYGSQCVVVAVDAKRAAQTWHAYTHGGRRDTQIDAVQWCVQAAKLGAGELLVTSMDCDGTLSGYDTLLLEKISSQVTIPLIASGGAGNLEHFAAALRNGADAVLAASVFHDQVYRIDVVKKSLAQAGFVARLNSDARYLAGN